MKLFSLRSLVLGMSLVALASTSPVFARHHRKHRHHHCHHEQQCEPCIQPCDPCCREFVFEPCNPNPELIDKYEEPGLQSVIEILEEDARYADFEAGLRRGAGVPIDTSISPSSALRAAIQSQIHAYAITLDTTLDGIGLPQIWNAPLVTALSNLTSIAYPAYVDALANGTSTEPALLLINQYVNELIEALARFYPPECFESLGVANKVRDANSEIVQYFQTQYGLIGDFTLGEALLADGLEKFEQVFEGIYHFRYKALSNQHHCNTCNR